ncbi:unnamed protein product, partial [Musa textilis]
ANLSQSICSLSRQECHRKAQGWLNGDFLDPHSELFSVAITTNNDNNNNVFIYIYIYKVFSLKNIINFFQMGLSIVFPKWYL